MLSLESSLSRQRITARQNALKSAQSIDLLELKLQAAHRALERDQRLFSEGLLNKTDFDKSKDDVQVATLELKNARESARLEEETATFDLKDREISTRRQESVVGELSRQVGELSIVAPFDGVVASVDVQDRDAVPANRALMTVVNLSAFEVEIRVAENEAADIAPGTPAVIVYEGRELPGKVTALSPEVKDSQVKGTVAFDGEPPKGLRQSQRVTVRLVFESRPNVLKAPRGPYLEIGGGRQLYVVSNGIATLRPITVGAVSVSEVEITSGLVEGDEIVLSDTTDFQGAKSVLLRK
jgi:HlyD family secretion protein